MAYSYNISELIYFECSLPLKFFNMIDITEISGLPIKIDEDRGRILCDDCLEYQAEVHVPLSKLTPILLNKYLKYPEVVYKHHINVKSRNSTLDGKFRYDLIHLPFGLLGIEFIKTHVYYSRYVPDKYDCVIEVYAGTLTIMIQKNREKEDPYEFETSVDDITVINIGKGQRVAIPTGVFYTFINTGMSPVIFAKITAFNHKEIDYSIFRREKGLAYYLISKNAKIEIVANPKYKICCEMKLLDIKKLIKAEDKIYLCDQFKESEEPLFNLFINNLFADLIMN